MNFCNVLSESSSGHQIIQQIPYPSTDKPIVRMKSAMENKIYSYKIGNLFIQNRKTKSFRIDWKTSKILNGHFICSDSFFMEFWLKKWGLASPWMGWSMYIVIPISSRVFILRYLVGFACKITTFLLPSSSLEANSCLRQLSLVFLALKQCFPFK